MAASEFDGERSPTGAALLSLRIVHHLEGASNQLLAEIYHATFHEVQTVRVYHQSCAIWTEDPIVRVDHCIQGKFVLESRAATTFH